MNTIYPKTGAHKPYPFMIDAPDLSPDETPLCNICIPRGWLPYVIGCCKTLTDPATWQVSGEDSPWTMAHEGMQLLHALMNPQDGCPEFPSGDWYCDYQFYGSEEGWVVWPDQDGEWGKSDSQGWHTQIKFNSNTQKYERKLSIRVLFPVFTYITAMQIRWSGNYEFAPGGYAYRQTTMLAMGGSLVRASHISTNPWDTAYEYGYTSFWPVFCDRVGIIAYIGQADTAAELEAFEMHVNEVSLWGVGDDPCPSS